MERLHTPRFSKSSKATITHASVSNSRTSLTRTSSLVAFDCCSTHAKFLKTSSSSTDIILELLRIVYHRLELALQSIMHDTVPASILSAPAADPTNTNWCLELYSSPNDVRHASEQDASESITLSTVTFSSVPNWILSLFHRVAGETVNCFTSVIQLPVRAVYFALDLYFHVFNTIVMSLLVIPLCLALSWLLQLYHSATGLRWEMSDLTQDIQELKRLVEIEDDRLRALEDFRKHLAETTRRQWEAQTHERKRKEERERAHQRRRQARVEREARLWDHVRAKPFQRQLGNQVACQKELSYSLSAVSAREQRVETVSTCDILKVKRFPEPPILSRVQRMARRTTHECSLPEYLSLAKRERGRF